MNRMTSLALAVGFASCGQVAQAQAFDTCASADAGERGCAHHRVGDSLR
jgi:hypothetical protein